MCTDFAQDACQKSQIQLTYVNTHAKESRIKIRSWVALFSVWLQQACDTCKGFCMTTGTVSQCITDIFVCRCTCAVYRFVFWNIKFRRKNIVSGKLPPNLFECTVYHQLLKKFRNTSLNASLDLCFVTFPENSDNWSKTTVRASHLYSISAELEMNFTQGSKLHLKEFLYRYTSK